jgi:hypothetical protein
MNAVTSPILQVAWVVNDIEEAMVRWQKTAAVGPFFLIANPQVSQYRHRGRPGNLRFSIAMAQAGPLQVELVQQHNEQPSAYRDVYARGQEGMHHICGISSDFDAELSRYQSLGLAIAHDGVSGDLRFAYVDTRPTIGCMTEILEDRPAIRDLFKMIADAAQNWDGTDPIRRIG